MELSQAKEVLNGCVRDELRDHAFGDVEVFWMRDGEEIASGYFGGGTRQVYLAGGNTFNDAEALELKMCGTSGVVNRNDETGPDTFVEGYIMPGLTKNAVKDELILREKLTQREEG